MTVFGAILTCRQSGQKLQRFYGNPMSNNFFSKIEFYGFPYKHRNFWPAALPTRQDGAKKITSNALFSIQDNYSQLISNVGSWDNC